MDLHAWKAAAREKLEALAAEGRAGMPAVLYGGLSAATIFPLVEATSQAAGQGDVAALMALGGLASNVGGNLVAEQISRWRDKSEAEIGAELDTNAEFDPEWRAVLDALLAEFEAPRVVQAILSEADRDWFVDSLRAELADLGSGLTLDVDGNLQVGDHNLIIEGDMTGGVNVLGDNVTLLIGQTAAELLAHLQPGALPATQFETITRQYLAYQVNHYRYLNFKGMGMSDRVALQLPLIDLYVPLRARIEVPRGETWAREVLVAGRKASDEEVASMGERLSTPQPLLDLLQQRDGLIILGDPGAGKTTFLKYLTLKLALGMGEEMGLGSRLPILVPLSAYANAIAKRDVPLARFLDTYYANRGIDLPVGELLQAALGQGRALLLLDGLDEVQSLTRRLLVLERVVEFFNFHRGSRPGQGNKFILTSRIVGYRDVRSGSGELTECTLVDFDADDIADFVGKWTHALERSAKGETAVAHEEAETERSELLHAVQRNPGVRQLAANPLLLTILALMKRQGVTLPERRAELYEKYVTTLLRHWNLVRGLDRRVDNERDLDVVETMRVLAPLALWMHEQSPGVGLVKREAMRRQLEKIYRQREASDPKAAARQLLADARDHASLLLERGPGEYGFIHLTFQEYLAAVAIAQLGQQEVKPVADFLAAHVGDDNWHEVTLLTIGYMGIVQQRDEAAGSAVIQLAGRQSAKAGTAAVLAGEAVVDTWPGGVTPRCKNAMVDMLLKTMLDDALISAPVRAAAGSTLGMLGDPRYGVGVRDGTPQIAWQPVASGAFMMGKDTSRYEDEKPTHMVVVADFRISRYPVTNEQYSAFVAATGHAAPEHWSEHGPQSRERNHPVQYVDWNDATAFCVWMSSQFGYEVRLPSEAEWEKAAKGDGEPFRYPWGEEEPDAQRCNFQKNAGTITPVGIYPAGKSPYGCLDMSGNVFEWTRNLWERWDGREFRYPYRSDDGRESVSALGRRVVRGGAFSNYPSSRMLCAARSRVVQSYRDDDVGFRVVASGF